MGILGPAWHRQPNKADQRGAIASPKRGIGGCRLLVFLLPFVSAGCVPGPTEQEIVDSLERTLRSVTGNWHGRSSGSDSIALDFQLRQGSNGEVTGTGRMKQSGAEAAVPFTVSGSYRRPVLALTFTGLRHAGERVQGKLQGDYVTVGGIATTLHLTGPNSSRSVPILLQED